METSVKSSEEQEGNDDDEIPELVDHPKQYTESSRYPNPLAHSWNNCWVSRQELKP